MLLKSYCLFASIAKCFGLHKRKWLHASCVISISGCFLFNFLQKHPSTRMQRSRSSFKINKGDSIDDNNITGKPKAKDHNAKRGRKKDVLEKFIESNQPLLSSSLQQLRHTILCESLPEICPYRPYIWSILLRASPVESEWYSGVVARGEVDHIVSQKIHNDVFRTFQHNKDFWSKVTDAEFTRVLNVFAWCVIENFKDKNKETTENGKTEKYHESIDRNDKLVDLSPYVQGMNVLCGPILYVSRSEPQAFTLFYNLLTIHLPRYITPNLDGALDGAKLVDLVLETVDPKLSSVLKKSLTSAKIYALPSILTLCACTPQLDEILKLWDFLFSYGVHLNIIFVVSQLVLIRDDLIKSTNPMSLLRQLPDLDSSKIIKLTLSITKNLRDDLYDLIVKHTYDNSVSWMIDNYTIE